MVAENAFLSSQEGLEEHFGRVFDINTVLGYDFNTFFRFCQYLGVHVYKPAGFAGLLQSPEEFVKHHVGNCWDQTELHRKWFEGHGYKVKTYLLYYYLNDSCCPSHSIVAFREGDKWCWFEPMFCGTAVEYSGVRRYCTEEDLLKDFQRVFALNGQKSGVLPQKLDDARWSLYEYLGPKYRIPDREFYTHCRKGRKIAIWMNQK